MGEAFMQEVDKNIKVLCNHEIELVLSLGFMDTKQFYYTIYNRITKEKIGQCDIRLLQSEENEYLGNIECEIFEPYQGKNLAYQANMLLSNVALFFGVRKVSIIASPSHFALIKTMDKLGTKSVCVKKVPKAHRLYKSESHEVACYEWILEEKGKQK